MKTMFQICAFALVVSSTVALADSSNPPNRESQKKVFYNHPTSVARTTPAPRPNNHIDPDKPTASIPSSVDASF